ATSIFGTIHPPGHLEALPRLAGYLANLRRARARDAGGVLLLDGGDMFQGTLESNMSEGAAVVRAYNALRYDAIAIGNHDFDYGPVGPAHVPTAPGDDPRGALKARAADARFPFLAANLIDAATGAPPAWPNVRGTTMVDVAGVAIGVIGLANVGTASMTQPANFAGLRALPLAPAAPDAAVEAAIAPALAAARAKRQEKLGVTVARAIVPAYGAESALGNLVADLMRAANPKADVALTNGGAIRAELAPGPLTYGQLHEVLPFDDGFSAVAMTGAELASVIARNL